MLPPLSVADVLLRTLAANGVTHLFGVPGGPLFALYRALSQQERVPSVLAKHEGGAAFMALGYAQARRGLGAVCTTTGPGATNAVTGWPVPAVTRSRSSRSPRRSGHRWRP